VSLWVYVEGGGDQGSVKSACRQAFRLFFEKIIPAGAFKVIASGGRQRAFDNFCLALENHPGDFVLLLVDSEDPVHVGNGTWAHLKRRDNWDRPDLVCCPGNTFT